MMYKEVLRAIADIDIYPVISLLLFVLVFGVAVVRAMRLDRRYLDEVARLPLDDPECRGRLQPALRPGWLKPAPTSVKRSDRDAQNR